jgi:hypothetical protein
VHRGGPFDPDKGVFFFISGRKGSGKSVFARRIFDSYPYDKLVIDPTGDVRKNLRDEGVQFVDLQEPMPLRFPHVGTSMELDEERRPTTAVYVPDMGSAEAEDEMDRALGLVLRNPGPTAAWVDEIGVLTRNGRTPPNLRRGLHHGRHDQLTLIQAGPRPKDIDPLCISQADIVVTFDTPNPMDRKRIAENIGWPPKYFDEAVFALGEHEYLMFNAFDHTLTHMPKLPPRRRVYAVGPVSQPTF